MSVTLHTFPQFFAFTVLYFYLFLIFSVHRFHIRDSTFQDACNILLNMLYISIAVKHAKICRMPSTHPDVYIARLSIFVFITKAYLVVKLDRQENWCVPTSVQDK